MAAMIDFFPASSDSVDVDLNIIQLPAVEMNVRKVSQDRNGHYWLHGNLLSEEPSMSRKVRVVALPYATISYLEQLQKYIDSKAVGNQSVVEVVDSYHGTMVRPLGSGGQPYGSRGVKTRSGDYAEYSVRHQEFAFPPRYKNLRM